METPTLVTERLRLRAFRREDFEDYAALHSDPEVLRYLRGGGGEPWDKSRSWRHLAFLMGHWQLGGVGMWAVEKGDTGHFVGVVGFAAPEGWPGLELAWTLVRRWWGHGYATEAAREALGFAFKVQERDRVISLIHPENQASVRVAERIGESLLSRTPHQGGEMLCYGLDRETYLAKHAPSSRHPGEEELMRFLSGDLPRPQVRSVVRHLLTQCSLCRGILRRQVSPLNLCRQQESPAPVQL